MSNASLLLNVICILAIFCIKIGFERKSRKQLSEDLEEIIRRVEELKSEVEE